MQVRGLTSVGGGDSLENSRKRGEPIENKRKGQ